MAQLGLGAHGGERGGRGGRAAGAAGDYAREIPANRRRTCGCPLTSRGRVGAEGAGKEPSTAKTPGVDAVNIHHDLASGVRDERSGSTPFCWRAARPGTRAPELTDAPLSDPGGAAAFSPGRTLAAARRRGVEVDVAELLEELGGAGGPPGSRADDHREQHRGSQRRERAVEGELGRRPAARPQRRAPLPVADLKESALACSVSAAQAPL